MEELLEVGEVRPIDPDKMRDLEHQARSIGNVIGSVINKGRELKANGFMLCLFSFEGPEFTYISNSDRQDMIKTLTELLQRLQSGEADQTSEQRN